MTRTGNLTRAISPDGFYQFGREDLAYIKAVTINGKQFHAVYAADGTPIMIANQRELAFAAVRQNDLQPTSVH